MAEDNLTFKIDVRLENGESDEKPFPGEYELTLTRNGELLLILLDMRDEWIANTRAPLCGT